MSVLSSQICVMVMPPALTMMVAMTVNVTLATLEMDFHVQVSVSSYIVCAFTDILLSRY